jgi:N-acetylated-alpha-linked acidic dipeptidase
MIPTSSLLVALLALASTQEAQDPPSRALLLEFTQSARLAGTTGSLRAARMVTRVLEEAGFEVEIDERVVALSLPRRLEIGVYADDNALDAVHERIERFDPDAIPPGDLPPFNAWSASGELRGQVLDAGYGQRADFERLRSGGVPLEGRIALCRYGKGYRGIKVELAEEFGLAGVLLFSDPSDDGAEKGEVWPRGPWKPDWEAQRGSISPMGSAPGDPSTPGFPSPAPGRDVVGGRRLVSSALDAVLPKIPCMPIGAFEANMIIERLATRRIADETGKKRGVKVGPGPVEVRMFVDAPRDLRTIRNVIGRLRGSSDTTVIAGNHRDAWVRGAHDAGGGTVSLLRAAQHLGARAREGWVPANTIALAFWDAEEYGLIGSTEWGEANAEWLRENTLAYINADAAVSGTLFGASGTPGLEPAMRRALARVEAPSGGTLLEQWLAGDGEPRLGLPGSGSDYAVFLHHLSQPVIDIGFSGNRGGQYHTSFDDFPMVERYLDPGFVGHELSGHFVTEILIEIADSGRVAFDGAVAARDLALHAGETAEWLGEEKSVKLVQAFEHLAEVAEGRSDTSDFYRSLEAEGGIPGRPWFKNRLWAPGIEKGYGADTFPGLRDAADETVLDSEFSALLGAIKALAAEWSPSTDPR